jgi:uncharacterized protein (TIGR03437 family)
MKNFFLFFAGLLLCRTAFAQISYTANTAGKVPVYQGFFQYGSNLGFYPGWSDEQLAEIGAGSSAKAIPGAGVKTLRVPLPENFVAQYGYNVRVNAFTTYASLGMKDLTVYLEPGYGSTKLDPSKYGGCGDQSQLFDKLYEPIWDGGANGTPVNENNIYANYVYKLVVQYKTWTKFWEVFNEPDFAFTAAAYNSPGTAGSWWDNNPNPCDLVNVKAPIFRYIRMLRISYEVVKFLDPEAYVCVGGLGYPSFLDAILRNTDEPNAGSVTGDYPNKGGAYFDCLSFHAYPQFGVGNNKHSDGSVGAFLNVKNDMQAVLQNRGYNGTTYPAKVFICTETNVPVRTSTESPGFGSDELQRNYNMKVSVIAQKQDVKQVDLFTISEGTNRNRSDNDMGLYKALNGVSPGNQAINNAGIGYKTTSDLLLNYRYDPTRTTAMNIPADVEGVAFRNAGGTYVYVLWAKTKTSGSENASATYSFPASLNITSNLQKREWDYSKTAISPATGQQNIALTGSPAFIVGDGANLPVPAVPVVAGFTPASVAAGGTLTINGSNFATTPAGNTVTIGGQIAVVTAASATQLTVTVPANASTGKITVTVNGQSGSSATDVTVTGSNPNPNPTPPTITGFSPASGASGTTVGISGTNFSTVPANNVIKFKGTTAGVVSATATLLTVAVPVGAATGKITVEVGGLTATSANDFTVTAPNPSNPVPVVTGFTPTGGGPGTSVVISGSNFNSLASQNEVRFNGVPATVTVASATQLAVTVPANASTGKITVTTNGQSGSSTTDFTVPPTAAEEDLKQAFGFVLSPNPASGEATLAFELTKSGTVSVSLFDDAGRLSERVVEERTFQAGKHQVRIPLSALTGGTYICRLTINKTRMSGRLAVVR